MLLAAACESPPGAREPSRPGRHDTEDTDTDAPEDTDTAADTDSGEDTDTAAADPGAALFTANCARCHGEDGTLGAEGAADLTVEVPGLTDAQITDVVTHGKDEMP